MDWRLNAGYIITNSITIGESEIVLGVHLSAPNQFATWECTNRQTYFDEHLFNDLLLAEKDFCKRGYEKALFYERHRKPKEKEPER